MLKTQLIRFLVVGGSATILNFALFLVLYKVVGFKYTVSSALGYIAGIFWGYFLNKNWTYEVQSLSDRYIFSYFFVYIVSLILGLNVLIFLTNILEIPPIPANCLTIGFTTFTNFLGTKLLVFKR